MMGWIMAASEGIKVDTNVARLIRLSEDHIAALHEIILRQSAHIAKLTDQIVEEVKQEPEQQKRATL